MACLVESAQILQRNVNFEIPALKKQMVKCQQTRDECHSRQAELEKNIHEIEKQYSQLAVDMSIEVNLSLFLSIDRGDSSLRVKMFNEN